jgi:hypothetical protein
VGEQEQKEAATVEAPESEKLITPFPRLTAARLGEATSIVLSQMGL